MADATQVYIFSQYERVPVFHLPAWLVGRDGYRDNEDGTEDFLVGCGRQYGHWSQESGQNSDRAIQLRRDHASLFARLCGRCDRLEKASKA